MREGDAGIGTSSSRPVGRRLRAGARCGPAVPATASARSPCSAMCHERQPWSPPSPARVLALDALSFKAAMAGPAAWAAAEATIADRLATSAPSPAGGRA